MSVWTVRGGNLLQGSITVQGAKNAVLPILAASILADCETELTNCPQLRDVEASLDILRHLGASADWNSDTIHISTAKIKCCQIPHELMRAMRSSVIFLGAILGRCGEAWLSMPGGCELGPRPIDLHLFAMRALGAEISEEGGNIICRCPELHGADIHFSMPSVGATENAMIAACAAIGETNIYNAAKEPEIVELQSFLQAFGADIEGAGTGHICIRGFSPRHKLGWRIMPDRIVSSTLLCACAAAGGDIELRGVDWHDFGSVLDVLTVMGCRTQLHDHAVRITSTGHLNAGTVIQTKPYPGFPTDAQPLMMACALKACGTTTFVENIFPNRFRQAEQMKRLGADIRVEGRVALVNGVSRLHGAELRAEDLRGGASLVVAALTAEGESRVWDNGHIERGYANLDTALSVLGADVIKTV